MEAERVRSVAVVVRPALAGDRPAVEALLAEAGLHAGFVASEFQVLVQGDAVVGCARLRTLGDGTQELTSVAVRSALRGNGLGYRLVADVLEHTPATVYALALAPGFFAKLGFLRLNEVPSVLRERAATECASKPFVPMVRG